MVQGALDVAGLAPVVGLPADVLNAGISVARGNYADAALSVAAAVPVLGTAAGAGKIAGKAAKAMSGPIGSRMGTETVQRAMSRAELDNIRRTGMLSRTKPDGTVLGGKHYVSNAVNSKANRARQRLALPGKPEVRVTLDVPKGVFSSPTKVPRKYGMPGGGLERIAPGNLNIPVRIRRVNRL